MKNKSNSNPVSAKLRQKAEKLLKRKPAKTAVPLSEAGMLKLIHELEVHQIELELQNQELALAKKQAAEIAKEEYADLYNFAQAGYFTLTIEGLILKANICGANMLGRERSRIKNSSFGFFVSDDSKPVFNLFLENVFNSETSVSCEVNLSTNPKTPVCVRLTGLAEGNGEQCFVTAIGFSGPAGEQEELQNVLSLIEATLESIQNGILVIGNQGNILKTNTKFAEMWGLPANILASGDDKTLLDYILGQLADPAGFKAKVAELYAKPDEESLDLICFLDGRIFERVSKPMYIGGKAQGRVWSFLDITEQSHDEEALRNSETLRHTLLQTLPDLVWLKDTEGVYLSCNRMFERFFGARETDIVGKTDFDFVDPELAGFFRENDRNAMAAGVPTSNEEWITFSDDGHLAFLDTIKTPMYDFRGTLIGVLGIGHDITERKRTEEAVLESEKKYRAIFDNVQDVFYQTDLDGKIREISPSIKHFSEFNRDELIGEMVYNLYSDPGDRTKLLLEISKNGQLRDYELKLKTKTGVIKHVSINASLNVSADGKPHHIDGALRDITDRVQAEKILAQTRENYETFFNTIDEFLFVLDEQGNIIHTNKTVTDRLGYTPAELLGNSVLMVHPPERREEAGRITIEMLKGNTAFCPVPLITKSRKLIPVETRVTRGLWDGKPALFGVTKDISEIMLSEEKFSKLFQINPSACGVSTLEDNKYIEVNQAFNTLLGFENYEVIGKSAFELGILTTETATTISGKADDNGAICNAEVGLRAKNGDMKHVLLSAENITVQDKIYRFTIVNDITGLKQADALFRDIVENNPMSIQIVDKEGFTQITNPAHTSLFGSVPPSDFSIFADLENKGLSDFIRQAKNGETVHLPDLYYNAHDIVAEAPDKSVWIKAVIFPLKDINGNPERFVFMHENITRRKEVEDEIREIGINYFGLFNSIKQAIYIQNPDLTFINVNQGAVDMYGYEREYFIGKTPGFLSAPGKNDLNKISELVALAFQGQPQNYEFWGIKKDGTVFLKDIWTVKGKYFGADVVITLASDISARRQAEEDLKESMVRYRALFENTGTSIIIIEEDATISLANDEFLRRTGYNRSETEGVKKWTEIVDSDDLARMIEQHKLRRETPGNALPSYEFRYRTKSGEVRNALINIRMEEGTRKSIASLVDITERKRTELEREALLEIMQGLVVTHDLKEFLGLVHCSVAKVIYAENFFVILYNLETGLFEEVYTVDKFDPPAQPSKLKDSISAYVFRTGNPLLITPQHFNELVAQGEMKLVGVNSPSWLGVPLKASGKTIGVMVVQDYDHPHRYSRGDTEFLTSIATQVALAVERWQAEDMLRRSEERYRTIVGNIGEGIAFVNAREQFVFANSAAEEIFGVGPGALEGMNLQQFVSKEQFESLQKQTQDRAKGIQSVYESDILRPGGEKRTLIVTAVPQIDAEKGFIGSWGVFRDITGRKQMEEDLRKSEERQRFIIESLPLAIYSAPVDSDTDTNWISGDVQKITGYDVEEYLSAKDFWRNRLHPKDKSAVLRTFKKLPKSKQAILEYRWKCKDGGYRWFYDRVVLIGNDSHQEYLGVIVDITGRKQAEEEINLLNTELEQRVKRRTLQLENANRELESFSYSVAHNLRSPLRGIDGWSMALLEEYYQKLDEKGRGYLDRVRNEAQHMGDLIDDLLKLSRVSRFEMKMNKVDFSAIVKTIAARLLDAKGAHHCEFKIQQGLAGLADPKMMEIALTNLLNNAFKFSGTNASPEIEFGHVQKKGVQVFFVRDNGVGFDMEYANNLFVAFQRMHKQSEFPGSGIGLATVHRIISKHGGTIWAESKPGEGSTFYFTINYAAESESESESENE